MDAELRQVDCINHSPLGAQPQLVIVSRTGVLLQPIATGGKKWLQSQFLGFERSLE